MARGVLPVGDRTTPAISRTGRRSRTTRCACSATAPSIASRAACTSRSRTACPATCRSASRRRASASSTTATSASCATAREKSDRNIELLRLQQAESAPTAFLHYNLGCEYAAAGDVAAALAEFERSWELLEAAADRDGAPVRAGAAEPAGEGAARLRAPARRARARRRGARALPRLHRSRARAGAAR